MKLKLQKKLAANVLKCSPKRVVFDTEKLDEIKKAIRKVDIRGLVGQGIIWKNPAKGVSRARANYLAGQVSKGRRRGHGSRKGKKTARLPAKREWINRIRAQRETLSYLKENKKISNDVYKDMYMKAKGGFFRSRRHLLLYIKEHGKVK